MANPIVLVVAATHLLQPLRPALHRQGVEVVESGDAEAVDRLRDPRPALVIVGCRGERLTNRSGIDAVQRIHTADPRLPIVALAEASSEDLAIAALKAGVTDYFREPFDEDEIAATVRGLVDAAAAVPRTPHEPAAADGDPALIGSSETIRAIREYVERIAATDASVLITGETGTGKDLVARLLHRQSARRHRPFVSINCAAIPDSLLESELFGYERGAFTGADAARPGHLSAAGGGTILLDEIGEMTPYAQVKILHALDTREIYRLGSTRKVPLDIRIVAATNQDLEQLIEARRFRRDLYYRLNVARIRIAPLRERRSDIPGLLTYYVAVMNRRFHRRVEGFTADAQHVLTEYDWPGNVREMKNVLEGVFAELPNRTVTSLDVPAAVRERLERTSVVAHDERDRLLFALSTTQWNVSEAARQLHWSRMTVYRKLAKYQLTRS